MKRLWVLACLASALAASCIGGASGAEADARLIPLAGIVRLERSGEVVSVDGIQGLVAGDVLATGGDGLARIVWGTGSRLELARDTRVRLAAAEVVEILRGSVLASNTPTIRVAGVRITASEALFRVDRALSTRVGVYRGLIRLPGFAAADVVPELRQVVVLGGGRGRTVGPLQIESTDPWDARFLADPIEIGSGLLRLQRGLAAQLPRSDARARSTVVEALPGSVRSSLSPELVRDVPPAELVVASGVSVRAARRTGVAPGDVLDDVVDLRAAGASWILVAAEWRLRRPALEAVVALSGRVAEAFREAMTPSDEVTPSGQAPAPGNGGGEPSGAGDDPTQGSEGDPPTLLPICDGVVGVVCDILEGIL
ncbi:MAG: hypothetical protein ACRDH6_08855 [Actinomycetota bacterium]